MRSPGAARVAPLLAGAMLLMIVPVLALGAIKEEPIPELKPPTGKLEAAKVTERSRLWLVWPLCGAAIGLSILMLSKRKPPQPVPPAERARKELAALNGRGDAAGVARVFREYVEAALGVRGRSATVEEMCASLAGNTGWSDALADRVRRFMDPVELAKFAPEVPAPPVERVVEEATALVVELEIMRGGGA